MKRRVKFVFWIFGILGYTILILNGVFKSSMTKFEHGFCEGSSCVLIIAYTIFLICCLIKRENPYKDGKL